MKCTIENKKIIVYIEKYTKNYLDDIDYLEDYFRKIFIKLKEKYDIKIQGFCNVDVYTDNSDMVLEIEEEKELVDYYEDIIDMKISIHESTFLYEVLNIFNINKYINGDIFLYKNKFYIKKKDMNFNILEHLKLVYKDTNKIINKKWRY